MAIIRFSPSEWLYILSINRLTQHQLARHRPGVTLDFCTDSGKPEQHKAESNQSYIDRLL